jgi:ABC-type glycerol-3-phosphate transport system permease component
MQPGHSLGGRAVARPRVALLALYFFLLALYLFPLYWMFSSAFKTTQEITRIPPTLWPKVLSMKGFTKVWQPIFGRYFLNSFVYAGVSVALALFTSSLIGFVLVVYPSKLGNLLSWSAICMIMIPFTILVIPLYLLEVRLRLLNSYAGMIAPRIIYPFGIFFMQLAVRTVPRDLVDAAKIDGCSPMGIYWRVAVPLLKTSLATLATLEFVWRWNELLWPLIVANSERLFPITVGLAALVDPYFIEFDQYLAASVMVVAPIIVIFLLLQRFFVRGIAITGMK